MLAAAGSLVAAIWAALHLKTLLLAAVTFLFLADYLKNRRPKNYPPGPKGLPFVGSIFQLDFEKPHLSIQPFVKKYGNIFSLNLGDVSSVFITGLPLIKEVFTHMEENILTRPVTPTRERICINNGLVFSSGQTWKEQRRFALMTLRNFGLGKKSLEQRMQEEARYLVEAIKEEEGQPFNPHFSINNAVSNIICSVTFGERFEYHDSQFQEMLRLMDEATCLETTFMCQLYNIFPWIMKYLPGSHQTVFRNWDKLKLFVSSIIDDHRRDWNPDEPRDFIDAFLTEMTKYPEKTTSFNEENLISSTLDLFLAGTETTSTTLRWALLYMALYPDVQEKVQAEIDRVIGQKRQASLADRESMPYTNAVVHEVQRMGNIVPLNVPREVSKDTSLNGFHFPKVVSALGGKQHLHRWLRLSNNLGCFGAPGVLGLITQRLFRQWAAFPRGRGSTILELNKDCSKEGPEGTILLTNLTELHSDPKEWATPETFNPEHFLENGQFKKRESFLPFSMGKRACLGEQLARSELFIFFTTLLQNFTFKPPVNEKLSLKFRMGLTLSPVSHHLCAVPRL